MGMEKLFESFIKSSQPDSHKLYRSSVLFSLFHLAVMWFAYIRQTHTAPYSLVIVHMVFVGVLYALPKEIQRWHNGTKPPATKAGHLLVLLWLLSLVAMCIPAILGSRDYKLPEGMTEMTCFLLAALGFTYSSKLKHELVHTPCPETPTSTKSENPPT